MTLIDVLSRPPRLPRALDRPRLHRLLLDGPEPACLVVAPPGSGKTVAAAQALDARPGTRRGWCRLSPGASGGADLVRLAASAFGAPLGEPGAGPLERAAALLDILGEQPTTLVVDDYDLARPEECDAVLAEVLALLPPDCRIVVCSAGRPAGLVGRAGVGDWRLVDGNDLAFTTGEVAGLLTLLGHDPGAASHLWAASGGWATAVALLAEAAAGGRQGLDAAVETVLDRCAAGLDVHQSEVLGVLSMVPSIGAGELEALDIDPAALARLATQTALLRPVGDRWGLLDVAREPLRRRLGPDQRQLAVRVAPVVAATDPVSAVEILLDAHDDAAAGDLLARHATAVPPDAALTLLYRMRPEVRRRLPPSLSAARATVEMDTALAEAEQRLATARHDRERVEAQVAVGAILVHRGQLASACTLLESALRAPRFTAVQAAAAAVGWLGLARLWAGDLDGAAATVASLPADPSPLARWVEAEVALARDDLAAAGAVVQHLRAAGWVCAAEATTARHALAEGAESAAAAAAGRAYQAATVHGGFDLLVAAPVHAWCLARAGRWDEAAAVADVLRRRLGAVDTCARLHADLVAEACAVHGAEDATSAAARHRRAIMATRRLGYALVEEAARRYLPRQRDAAVSEQGLRIGVLGPIVIEVDGRPVDDGAWRSRKAREVLVAVALAGDAGRSRDEVIEAVWPERDPDRGRSLLRTALAEVRRCLEPARPPGEPSRFVVTRGDRIVVTAYLDVTEVEAIYQVGSMDDLVVAWRRFRGPAVADEPYTASLDDLRSGVERLQLDVADAMLAAVAGLAPSDLTVDVLDAVVGGVEHVIAAEPWRSEVATQVAASCRAAGHDTAAARIERVVAAGQ